MCIRGRAHILSTLECALHGPFHTARFTWPVSHGPEQGRFLGSWCSYHLLSILSALQHWISLNQTLKILKQMLTGYNLWKPLRSKMQLIPAFWTTGPGGCVATASGMLRWHLIKTWRKPVASCYSKVTAGRPTLKRCKLETTCYFAHSRFLFYNSRIPKTYLKSGLVRWSSGADFIQRMSWLQEARATPRTFQDPLLPWEQGCTERFGET